MHRKSAGSRCPATPPAWNLPKTSSTGPPAAPPPSSATPWTQVSSSSAMSSPPLGAIAVCGSPSPDAPRQVLNLSGISAKQTSLRKCPSGLAAENSGAITANAHLPVKSFGAVCFLLGEASELNVQTRSERDSKKKSVAGMPGHAMHWILRFRFCQNPVDWQSPVSTPHATIRTCPLPTSFPFLEPLKAGLCQRPLLLLHVP